MNDRLKEIDDQIRMLEDYRITIPSGDPRLVYQVTSQIERLYLEKEDIVYGTHNIQIKELASDLLFYRQLLNHSGGFKSLTYNNKVVELECKINYLIDLDNEIRNQNKLRFK